MKGNARPEKAVSDGVRAFMAAEGWRCIRHNVGGTGNFRVGEKGMPDLQFIYYRGRGSAFVVWVEVKAPGYKARCNCKEGEPNKRTGKPTKGHECRSCGQLRWHEEERARGALVVQTRDVEDFKDWYRKHFGQLA